MKNFFYFCLCVAVGAMIGNGLFELAVIVGEDRSAERYVDVVETLASENCTLIEREAKMLRAVSEFEDENRSLKSSLSESVGKIQEQSEEINELIDSNSIYMLQIRTYKTLFERTNKELEKTKKELEKALAVPQPC